MSRLLRPPCPMLCTSLKQLVTIRLTGVSDKFVLSTSIQTCCNKIVTKLTTQCCNNIVMS